MRFHRAMTLTGVGTRQHLKNNASPFQIKEEPVASPSLKSECPRTQISCREEIGGKHKEVNYRSSIMTVLRVPPR